MQASDTFPIGSTTKSFTAVLVMALVAQGKVSLDAQVSRYLPGVLPYGNRITIKELLSHTSGLIEDTPPKVLARIAAGDLGYSETPEQSVAYVAEHPLLFKPGTRFNYTDSDYKVLGLVLERVTGDSYGELLSHYILRPLKLSHTTLPMGTTGVRPDVHGYVPLRAYVPAKSSVTIDTTLLSPLLGWAAGGIRSTVEDVANFYRGLFTGKLIPRSQVAEMEDTAPASGQYGMGLMPTGGDAYVWGGYTQTINTTCGRAWGHGGHFPGYYFLPISSPDGSRQALLLVNVDPYVMGKRLIQVYDLLDAAYCQGVPAS